MLRANLLPVAVLATAVTVLLSTTPAPAQYGEAALIAPGEPVPVQLVLGQGGSAGRELAPLLGKRPVLVVYWRPRDSMSEQVLVTTAQFARASAAGATLFPVAVLAASQPPSDIAARLSELGLAELAARQDGGQLAMAFGLRRAPGFALIDAGGVLRAVGGSDISQVGAGGVSIGDALVAAARGEPVPTLGTLAAQPIYRLLGRPLPDGAVTELDGRTWRKLSEYVKPGHHTLVFAWLPTCPHCRELLPKLREWYERTRPEDLRIVDIARAEAPALQSEAASIVKNFPWVHLLDVDRAMFRSLLVVETPTVYLIGHDGNVEAINVGASINWDKWLNKTR